MKKIFFVCDGKNFSKGAFDFIKYLNETAKILLTGSGKNAKHFSSKTPVKWISVFLLFISLPLVVVEAGQCINYIATGKLPAAPVLIFALDLSIVYQILHLLPSCFGSTNRGAIFWQL